MDFIRKALAPIHSLAFIGVAMLSSIAHADNQAALKDAIGNSQIVAEAKAADTKATSAISHEADFKKLDSNGDQKISIKEAVKDKSLATHFDAVDINKDGMVSIDEYTYAKSGVKAEDSAVNPVN